MHVLFATTDFVENSGPTTGLPKYLLRTSLKLVEWGNEVTIVTCSNRTVKYELYGINVYRVRGFNIQMSGDAYRNEVGVCLRNAHIIHQTIAQIIQKVKIDIIQYASLSGIAYYHDFNIPSIVRLSSYAKMWPLIDQEEIVKARTEMEIAAAKKCDAIIGPSNVVAIKFAEDIGRRVDVIETPFVMEHITEDYTLYNCLLKDIKYLLFFGYIIEYKGVGVLAECVNNILSRYPYLYLVVIGDGDKRLINEVEINAGEFANRVIYHQAIGFGELVPIIKNAYAVLLPSLMENFSNACVEAMALKKIVIGTNGVSFEQLISDGENGFLCEPGNSQSLLDAIYRLMNLKKSEKSIMEEKAFMRTTKLVPETVTAQLVEYYENVISDYKKQYEVMKNQDY